MRSISIAVLLVVGIVTAQTTESRFEVASIKPSTLIPDGDSNPESIDTSPGGRLTMTNIRLSACLQWAYDIQESQVMGPAWISQERYNSDAQAPGPARVDQVKRMVRSLVADRFKLAFHREQKDGSVYALVVAKDGPKFRASDIEGKSNLKRTAVGVIAENTSMLEFADLLSAQLGSHVADMTRLQGRFDLAFDLRQYVAADGAPLPIAGLMLQAMEEQLGLKLQTTKTSIELLVIDHIEKPSPN